MNEPALKEYYGTLSETINALNDLGYTLILISGKTV